ncbi:MAG: NAD-dependent succinate-semialdehyde dehydrogenase [Microbacteriaceae bacterium]|nr:NAD-dependent succinate-semialdehyde dehydrogenase [Microbacteriaceae bacterium]
MDAKEVLTKVPTQLFVNGKWVNSSTGKKIPVYNPANDELLVEIQDASPADALSALDAAVAAQDEWAATSPRYRGELLRKAFDLITERKEFFATLMTLEMGKPYAEALGEVAYGAEFLRWFSEEAPRIAGRFGSNPEGTGQIIVAKRPVGPSFLITPWNFPLAMATRKIAPAMAAGCTSIVKPATLTPLTTLAFVDLLREVGVPAGVVNVITSSSASSVSNPIIEDSRLRKLSFTGSTEVGKMLMQKAANGVLRVSMELGGNAPFVVFEDADLDKAVAGALQAKFRNIGQACTAANRFIVHEDVADEFARRISETVAGYKVGDGLAEGVNIGPLIDQDAVAKVGELVEDATKRGAKLLSGGSKIDGAGNFFQPTVVDTVPAGSEILAQEIFGPVVAIQRFKTEDEAVALANSTEYGLVSYVFTEDLNRGMRMIQRLESGMMGLNTGLVSNAAAPFGGVKQSGVGREGSFEGINEYLETKYVLVPNS